MRGDPDAYAAWRAQNIDDDEKAGFIEFAMGESAVLAFFRIEWYDALETPESIASEDMRTTDKPNH